MSPTDTSFLNPVHRALLAVCPEVINFDKVTIQQARNGSDVMMQTGVEMPPVDIQKIEIVDQTDGHPINVTVYKPKNIPSDAKLPAFVYFPGGGFCVIHEPSYAFLLCTYAVDLNCIVLFVNYSLSPEVQFPVALYENYSVVEYATSAKTASTLQIDPKRVAVGGDSAGGNMATAVSLLAMQRNQLENSIRHQILYYPCLDNNLDNESYTQFGEGFFLTRKMAVYFLKSYGPDKELQNMLLFPNKAPVEALVGMPPAFLVTCEADILRDEGESYGRKLIAANVPVTSFRANGVIHGFMSSPSLYTDESYQVIDMTKTILRKVFNASN